MEKIARISTRQIKSIGKGRPCKNKKRQKIHKLTNAQIDALLTKIMGNEASRAYIENMQNQEWHISQIDPVVENAFEIAARTSFSSTAKISLRLSSKNNAYKVKLA